MKAKLRKLLFICLSLAALALITLAWCNHRVTAAAENKLFDRAGDLPRETAALVLGCSPKLADGRTNLFFTTRMDAAAELYRAGKAKLFIVSGDNRFHNYDEPTEMKKALMARGIPEKNIICDFAGRRTLDSVLRARDIFSQNSFIVVSQPFHNIRALYIADKNGIHAVGYNAADINPRGALKVYLREALARTKAVIDVEMLGLTPEIMGPKESLPSL